MPEPVHPEPIPESEREEVLAPRSAVLAAPGPIPVPPGPVAGTDPPLAPSSPPMAPPPPEPPPVSPVDAPGMAEGEQPVAEAGEPEVDAATREILDLEARFLADPNDRRAHFELAEAYLARGRAGDAVEAFRELAQAAPSPGAYLGLARACLGAGLVGDAVPVLQELVRMAPASPEARKARAVLGRIPGVEVPEAPVGPSVPPPAAAPGPQAGAAPVPGPPPAAAPKVAPVAAAPESPASVPAAARASVPPGPGSDQPPIGMERLEAILTTFLPDDRDRWLGFAHQVGGFGVGVLRTIQRLVEQDPGNLPAREFLAFVHLSHGRAAVAAKVFETLMDRRPDDARYPLYLGNTLLAAGEARAAAQRWREAARLDPESPAGLMAAYLLETLKGAVR